MMDTVLRSIQLAFAVIERIDIGCVPPPRTPLTDSIYNDGIE
jgi:hypothetical protein